MLLTHFDLSQKIVVAADVSSQGVGAVISHIFPDESEKAIMYAARSMTPEERNYNKIEKGARALIFVVKKFHKMIFGRRFTLLADHKPLLSIFGFKRGFPCTQPIDYNVGQSPY